jgi:hypothetical protein
MREREREKERESPLNVETSCKQTEKTMNQISISSSYLSFPLQHELKSTYINVYVVCLKKYEQLQRNELDIEHRVS